MSSLQIAERIGREHVERRWHLPAGMATLPEDRRPQLLRSPRGLRATSPRSDPADRAAVQFPPSRGVADAQTERLAACNGTELVAYAGVDLSPEALRLASRALALAYVSGLADRGGFVLERWKPGRSLSSDLDQSLAPSSAGWRRSPRRCARRAAFSDAAGCCSFTSTRARTERIVMVGCFAGHTRLDWMGLTAEEWLRMDAHVRTYDFRRRSRVARFGPQEAFRSLGAVRRTQNLLRLFAFQP